MEQELPITTQEYFDEGSSAKVLNDLGIDNNVDFESTLEPSEPLEPSLEYSGDAFVSELLYGSDASIDLHAHITNFGATDDDGLITDTTRQLAKLAGISDKEIAQHQQYIYDDIEAGVNRTITQINEASKANGFTNSYTQVVMEWAKVNLSQSEKDIFEQGFKTNPTAELKALEKYYIKETK